jgi:4-hydroxyphenylpyruvate dioxygenase
VLPFEDIDYIEIYTGNAKQTAFYYSKLFGFEIIAYSGLETGNCEKVSYLLQQGDIRVMISGGFDPDYEIAEFVKKHGHSVKDIALRVKNLEITYRAAVERGGIPLREPFEESGEYGKIKKAVIGAYGDTVHTLIERTGSQQAINMLARLLLNPGGQVMMEEISYPGFMQVLEPFQAEVLAIPTDYETGIRINPSTLDTNSLKLAFS